MKIKHFIFTIAALGALASCNYEYPEIDFSQTYSNDYSEVVKTLEDQSKTISEKLSALETAMSNQTMSLEQKLDLLKKAVDDQNMALSDKLNLLTAAVDNGVIKYEEMSKKIADALNAMAASDAEQMSAIEQAIKDQTTGLTAKLALVEATVQKGFADTDDALGLVKDAIISLEGTMEEKLAAIEKSINDQKVELSAKLVLIQGAVEAGFADNVKAIGYVKDAITSLEGTLEEKLNAIDETIKAQTVELSAKLVLIQGAVETGFVNNVEAIDYVKTAINTLDGTVDEKLNAIDETIKAQTVELSAKLVLIQGAVETGFVNNVEAIGYVQDAINTLKGTVDEKLNAIDETIKAQTVELSAKLVLIQGAVQTGFVNNVAAIGYVKDAINTLGGTMETKLAAIETAITSQTTTLSGKLDLIDGALDTGLANIAQAQGLIETAVKSLKGDYSTALTQIKEAVESMATKLETKLGAIKESVDNGVLGIKEGQELIDKAIENASAESVVSGLNKDQILGLDLTKGCAIVTTDFWSKYYNSEGSDYYKKVSALLDVTLPIPNSLSINLHLRGFQYDDYPKYDQSRESYGGCATNCNITTRVYNNSPRLMVANVDRDWAGSALTDGKDTGGLMAYSNNFAFLYKGRSACAVYKVIPYANINYHRNRMKEVELDEDGQVIKEEYAMVAAVFNVYCNKNSNSSATTQLANDFHAQAEAYIFYPTAVEDDSFVVNLSGDSMIVDGKFDKNSYDKTLEYIFPYTDYRYGNTLEVEAIYQTGGYYD